MSRVTVTFAAPHTIMAAMQVAIDNAAFGAAVVAANETAAAFGTNHGGIPSRPGGIPHSQEGTLRRSVVAVHPKQLGALGVARYGTNIAYGRFLEFGGLITPKTAKTLAIPANGSARRAVARGRSPREVMSGMGKLTRIPLRSGGWMIGKAAQRGGRLLQSMPIFVLKWRVYVSARPWIRRTAMRPDVQAKMLRHARDLFRRSFDVSRVPGARS